DPWVQVRNSRFFSIPVCRYPTTARSWVTVSPSSSSTSRSTPWVDGCCGPMLTTIFSSSIGSRPARTSSQSAPVTVKTLPSGVSWTGAYPVVMVGTSVPGSLVGPPGVRRRDLGALVLHRHPAERVVLPLRVALPVVRHQNSGQPGVAVEDDAEHVVDLPLLPVGGRVDLGDAGQVRILDRDPALQPDHPAVGHRGELVDHVQPPPVRRVRVVHARHAAAQLEPQGRVVAQHL